MCNSRQPLTENLRFSYCLPEAYEIQKLREEKVKLPCFCLNSSGQAWSEFQWVVFSVFSVAICSKSFKVCSGNIIIC